MKILNILFFLIIFIASNLSAEEMKLPERLAGRKIAVHRTGSIYIMEAHASAIKKSLREGADILEMDLQLTKDRKVIVYHDSGLDYRTKCSGPVKEKTWEELKECRLKRIYPIMTFEDVLKQVQGKAVVNAEFKTRNVIIPAIKLVQKYNAYEWVYFQNMSDPGRYQIAREFDPDVYLHFAAKTDEHIHWVLAQKDIKLLVIGLSPNMQRPDIIDKLHKSGKITSANTWKDAFAKELFKANCTKIYSKGIRIAVTQNLKSCKKQRQSFQP